MTAIVAWLSGATASICADSVVSSPDPLLAPESSFGETHVQAGVAAPQSREEGAFKILRLNNILAAMCGDVANAAAFVEWVWRELSASPGTALSIVLERASAVFTGKEHAFTVIFAHCVGHPALAVFSSTDGTQHFDDAGSVVIAGSLSDTLRGSVLAVMSQLLSSKLEDDVVLVTALAYLQSLGVSNYLIETGVGGAFFGASIDMSGIRWQPDISYLLYDPRSFANVVPVARSEQPPDPQADRVDTTLGKVRCAVRKDAGVICTSVAEPGVRVLVPATSTETPAEWETYIQGISDTLLPLAPGRCFVFLGRVSRKLVVVIKPHIANESAAFVVSQEGPYARMLLHPRLTAELETAVLADTACEIVLIREPQASGGQIQEARLRLRVEHR